MRTKVGVRLISLLLLIAVCAGCHSTGSESASGQRTADYVAVIGNETDRLELVVTRGSNQLSGYLDVSIKKPDGSISNRRVLITGEVSTDGVPSALTIP